MPRMVGTLVLVALTIAIGAWIWSAQRVADAEARVRRIERRADSISAAYRESKRRAEHEQAVSKRLEHKSQTDAKRLREQLARVRQVNDSVRSDTSDAVQVLVSQSDSLVTTVEAYVSLIDTLRSQHARERLSLAAALADADSTIAVQNALNAALRAERCRVWGRPCPSRSQAFMGGALLVTLLVLR